MFDDQIPRVRSFNRTVSQVVGALNDHYLGRDRPLGEARIIFEIGKGGADLRDLRARLALDSGYLSRLLRSLERQALVAATSASDKRVRRVKLTRAGLAELREINRRSDSLARSILDPLTKTQRARLIDAMAEVERLLAAATATIDDEPADSPTAHYCLGEYFREIGARFETGFDPARSLPMDAAELIPPNGAFLVMRLGGQPVGCGAFKRMTPEAAYIKRMWIAGAARGLGLGRRLLEALEDRARSFGYRVARLETNRALTEAQSLYRRCGYGEVAPFNDEPYAHHWFEKRLV